MSCGEWDKLKLKEICKKIGSGATPSGGSNAYKVSGISLVRSQNVLDFSFSVDGLAFIDDEQAEKLNGVTVESGDVLINITGDSVARTCIVPEHILPARVNQHVSIVRVDRSKASNKFLIYYLQNLKPFLLSMASNGATRNALTKRMIEQLEVRLPALSEQKAIADTLSSLDNKIELNNRINKTLEEMAQAIFKQWFVDFDFPDENGQPYKSSGGEMEESELGLIPQGWRVGVLGDIANNIRDGVASGNITNNTAYIGLEHMPRKCLALSNWDEKPELMSNKFKFNEGDILFGKLRPYFHKVVVASISGICSTDILVINVKEPRWYSFALMHLFAEIFIDYTSAVSTGTKMPRTNWSDMARYQIIMPSFTLVDQFEDLIQPSLWAIKKNVLENRSLAKTRDTLLPKLMSGEIRVPIKEAAR